MPAEPTPSDFKPKSDLVRDPDQERGHIYQATDLAGLDAAAAKGPITGLHRLRRHCVVAARRQPGADHDAAPVCRKPATDRSR